MKKILISVIAGCLLSALVWAQSSLLRNGHPDEYVVKKGDTLWDISGTFLNKPWRWPEIWHVNPQIENPHLIFPGDVIRLVYLDGQPRLTLERTHKLSDSKLGPKIRVQSEADAITTIPLDKIDSFLSRSRILETDELSTSPYMLAGPSGRIVVGEGDRAYARGDLTGGHANYGVYRKGKVYKDPQTGEFLGIYAQGIGQVAIDKVDADVATLEVLKSYEEIRPGDRLLPSEDRPLESLYYPSAPVTTINGEIIDVEGGVSQVGRFNVIIINRGERDGLVNGNVLALMQKGELVKDRVRGGKVQLPSEKAGLAMVFRTFDKISLALVLEAERPLAVGDLIANP
ncbi:MAG: LysM peptidoglycan-binding domain-containing protein [Cellvibrio sp.]